MRLVIAALGALLLVGAGISIGRWAVPSQSAAGPIPPGATTSTSTSSTSTPEAPSTALPVEVSSQLSTSGEDATILVPSSCAVQGSSITANGSFDRTVTTGYLRSGDVVELYAYTAPVPSASNQTFQVVKLASEKPFPMGTGGGTWEVSGTIDSQIGVPQRCLVAVQATHAGMGAGNAY